VKKDGSTILIEVNSKFFNGKDGFLLVGKDVSNLKEMQEHLKNYTNDLERQIEKRTQELLEMQQFASAGKIASMVGHDLRSPLQSIRNATYLLRKQPERSEEILKSVDLSVDRALSMLEELRYKTRETPLTIKATDLHDLIVDILQDIPIPKSVKVNVRLDSELKEVEIDSLKIRRVIDNLIRNAIEAMPTGGILTIETQSKGEAYAVIITDTGVGIPEGKPSSLFKPFYTKRKELSWVSLSLKTVEAHGGIIEVDSKVGKGTEFKILLNKHPIVKTAEEKKK
jgi:signal transduction histidine kinase